MVPLVPMAGEESTQAPVEYDQSALPSGLMA